MKREGKYVTVCYRIRYENFYHFGSSTNHPHRQEVDGLSTVPLRGGIQKKNILNEQNYDFCDENSHHFDGYGDENYQKTDKYHGFLVKIYPF